MARLFLGGMYIDAALEEEEVEEEVEEEGEEGVEEEVVVVVG